MKLEIKNNVQEYIDNNVVEAVKLLRNIISQRYIRSIIKKTLRKRII